jgi:hypothetical protein
MSTRRDILKGLAAVPLLRMGRSQGLILPGGSSVPSGQTFDYYISPSGSGANVARYFRPR